MKFLQNDTQCYTEGSMSIWVKRVTTAQQSVLMSMARGNDVGAVVDTTIWILKNLTNKVTIEGKQYDPLEVAEKSDLSDQGTMQVFVSLGSVVMEGIFSEAEQAKKKPLPPQSRGSKAKPAPAAPGTK